MTAFAMKKTVTASFDEALARVPEALRSEGFGILSEIDVQDTLCQKLGVEFPRYRILGACNPPLAHAMLRAMPEIGLLMPCNLVVYEDADGRTVVAAVDPTLQPGAADSPAVQEGARTVRDKLIRVLQRLE